MFYVAMARQLTNGGSTCFEQHYELDTTHVYVHSCVFVDRNTLLAATRGDALKLINLRMNQVSGTLRLVLLNSVV